MISVGLYHFLIVSAILFALGLYALLTRRSVLMVLIGIELIITGAAINFAAFAKYGAIGIAGEVATFFITMFGIIEAAVAIAIILNFYKDFKQTDLQELNRLRD